jgi:hypothetical protein
MRGKYAKRFHAGTNLVRLDPDVRKAFLDEIAKNEALRLVIELRKVGSRRVGCRKVGSRKVEAARLEVARLV